MMKTVICPQKRRSCIRNGSVTSERIGSLQVQSRHGKVDLIGFLNTRAKAKAKATSLVTTNMVTRNMVTRNMMTTNMVIKKWSCS